MPGKILVTYSTKYGSTEEVAETIARILKEKYFTIDFMKVKEVSNLNGYDAIILGTPIYAGSFLSETRKFLTQFKESIEIIPTVLFILGPLGNSPQEMRGVKAQLSTNLGKFPWFKPTVIKIFSGALDLKKLRFPDSLIKLYRSTPQNKMQSSDARDWKEIQAWAGSLPDLFHMNL
ncbi:flavodoxin domain-containing protein [Leptolinea tardivitalis]|uniref:Flavodoxin-like domain-containing protein n=1 Tax=Leptolinea tardivitalis TaxID=229920 RepID=A0A0P6WYX8_9CHLR|nr:flavodoxin domain-containing protein [Leptolinea tardivitalis]KPL71867.1 hypothetical protein ADM99_10680 [Leptolinea tardivitalis]GAP20269.1 flavodoxin [Leptolinea tardivitalis]